MKHIIFIVLGILMHLLILTQSLLPANISSNQSGFIVDFLYPLVSNIGIRINIETFSHIVRKLAHFTEFFLLGVIWYVIYMKYFNKAKLVIVVLIHGLLSSIADETIQLFVDGRSGEIRDVLIDFSGVILANIMMYFIFRLREKRSIDKGFK